ncbi:hypothetical protein D3C72_1823400 [compost metagenome]
MSDKQALKAAYKQDGHRFRAMGVYQIKNQANGKVYLAASPNIDGTMGRDRTWLRMGNHLNKALQQEWKAYGPEAFAFEVLELLTPTDEPRNYPEELALLLEVWLETLQPYDERGYMKPPRQ